MTYPANPDDDQIKLLGKFYEMPLPAISEAYWQTIVDTVLQYPDPNTRLPDEVPLDVFLKFNPDGTEGVYEIELYRSTDGSDCYYLEGHCGDRLNIHKSQLTQLRDFLNTYLKED